MVARENDEVGAVDNDEEEQPLKQDDESEKEIKGREEEAEIVPPDGGIRVRLEVRR